MCCVYKPQFIRRSCDWETPSVKQYAAFIHSSFLLKATSNNYKWTTRIIGTLPTYSSHRIPHLWKLLRQNQTKQQNKTEHHFWHFSFSHTLQWVHQAILFYFQHCCVGLATILSLDCYGNILIGLLESTSSLLNIGIRGILLNFKLHMSFFPSKLCSGLSYHSE